jgi:hypothetical protein
MHLWPCLTRPTGYNNPHESLVGQGRAPHAFSIAPKLMLLPHSHRIYSHQVVEENGKQQKSAKVFQGA